MLGLITALLLQVVTLEHAVTKEQLRSGLMGRTALPEDHGMLFSVRNEAFRSVWMFNCYCDLDVAFLDQNGIILKIATLKAHPEWMRLLSQSEIDYPSPTNPIVQLFQSESLLVPPQSAYIYETRAGWFAAHRITPGYQFRWSGDTGHFFEE